MKSFGSNKQLRQWSLLLGVLTLFAALLVITLYLEHKRVVDEQFDRLTSKATVIDQNMMRQLAGVDAVLKSALAGYPMFSRIGDQSGNADPFLSFLANSAAGVRTVFLLDTQGDVLAASRPGLAGRNFSKREYFTTPSQFPAPDVLYLSQPFTTVLGVYSMNAVRVATNAQGKMERLAAVTLDPEFFVVLLSSVRFEPDVVVTLAHEGGALVLRYPPAPELLGTNLRTTGSLFSRHVRSSAPATVLMGSSVNGQQVWTAQRNITAPQLNMVGSLVVAVQRDPSVVLAPWRNLVATAVSLWLVVAMLSSLALFWFHFYQRLEDERLAEADSLRRQAEDETRRQAYTDVLTGLPNRRQLFDRMMQMHSSSRRHQRFSALVFLDLDGFKQLNDSLGHEAGDLLLKEVAKRLDEQIRQEDMAARWAGDEFVVALSELSGDKEEAGARAMAVAEKVLASLAEPYNLKGVPYRCTASAGVTLFGTGSEPMEVTVRRADMAMYQAKAAGRNRASLFPIEMIEQAGNGRAQARNQAPP